MPYYYTSAPEELEIDNEETLADAIAEKVVEKIKRLRPWIDEEQDELDLNGLTELDKQIQEIFQDRCISCHKAGSDKPGVKLFNDDGVIYLGDGLDINRRFKIFDSVFGGEGVNQMPKNGDALSDEETELVRQWVRETPVTPVEKVEVGNESD